MPLLFKSYARIGTFYVLLNQYKQTHLDDARITGMPYPTPKEKTPHQNVTVIYYLIYTPLSGGQMYKTMLYHLKTQYATVAKVTFTNCGGVKAFRGTMSE